MSKTLKADGLYLGDNGRCFCGELRCAGSSAHFDGRGISGQPVLEVTTQIAAEALAMGARLRCESCGKEATQ
jgi:hypothetical protein